MNEKLKRFEQALERRKDPDLATFYNELYEEFVNPYTVENMLAKTEWMLLKSQSENHKLMIEFLEEMEIAKNRIR